MLLPDSGSEHGASPMVGASSSAARLVPQGRGNYQLLGEIARGGMGVILKGHDTDLGRDVAVKVLDSELAKNPAVVQRFVEEAQVGGQLQHPGIVPVYELGLMEDERPYFTMKLVKGRTLAALFQQRRASADNRGRLLAIFESVCQTVAYAHSKGVLHRDLKPANIMVGAFGEVQVVDWGLAKVLSRGGVADEKRAKETLHSVIATVRSGPGSTGSDSMVGSVLGTPAYMAPEQAQGEVEQLDERADVFSLGAILCELLTGRPPYEGSDPEPIVVQAAKARLDGARARLEACDADRALVQLCLDCLMPARAARPANADEVAQRLHGYLTSVEERAQKAELAAVEARVKAAEERRARRLTLALAGTVATAVLCVAGGVWWLERVQSARREETRAAVESAQSESLELARRGKPEEALAAARRAFALVESPESPGADDGLRRRAAAFVAQAEGALAAAEKERELARQDDELVHRLEALRIAQMAVIGNRAREGELDRDYAAAFRRYGIDLEGVDVVPALGRLRERKVTEEVALSLDDWGRLRRKEFGPRSEKVENLFDLAMDLDPDPERQRMRRAIFENDLGTMLELASPERLHLLPPGSIFVLSAAIWDSFPERRPEVYRMYDQALNLYPDDYVLQSIGGAIYDMAGRVESALVCRNAAVSLRPGDSEALGRKGESLMFVGRLTEAEGAFAASLAVDPKNRDTHWSMGTCLTLLGRNVEALEHLRLAMSLQPDPDLAADVLGARYLLGQATRAEMDAMVRGAPSPMAIVNTLFPLVDHPDSSQRDPAYVLAKLEEFKSVVRASEWMFVLDAMARARAGDFEGAAATLEGHAQQAKLQLMTPEAYSFLRAIVFARLGRGDVARECYDHGLAGWRRVTGGDPGAWERSQSLRWKREAEAALGL